jgi:hypothetical protein
MACGILPAGGQLDRLLDCGYDLPLRDHTKSVETQLSRAFKLLNLDEVTVETLHQSLAHKNTKQIMPGFADLLGLWTRWLPLSIEGFNTVENPFPIEVEPMGKRPEARVVWQLLLLQQYPSAYPKINRILEIYNHWESLDPTRYHTLYAIPPLDVFSLSGLDYILSMRTFFKEVFDETERYFIYHGRNLYAQLVSAHVAINAQSLKQAEENIRTGLVRPYLYISQSSSEYQGDPIFTERAFVYVDNIPKIVSIMDSRKPAYMETSFEEAWWMMMIRMQAWNMGVNLVRREGMTVPHYYYNDPSRVYIL